MIILTGTIDKLNTVVIKSQNNNLNWSLIVNFLMTYCFNSGTAQILLYQYKVIKDLLLINKLLNKFTKVGMLFSLGAHSIYNLDSIDKKHHFHIYSMLCVRLEWA